MDDDKLKNARKKVQEQLSKMTPQEKRKAGQIARQILAEDKEARYQGRVTCIRYAMAIFICIIVLAVIYAILNGLS